MIEILCNWENTTQKRYTTVEPNCTVGTKFPQNSFHIQ